MLRMKSKGDSVEKKIGSKILQNVTKRATKADHILRSFAKQESGDMGKDMRMGEKKGRN